MTTLEWLAFAIPFIGLVLAGPISEKWAERKTGIYDYERQTLSEMPECWWRSD